LALLLLCAAPALAGILSSDAADEEAKAWTELEVPLPSPPKPAGLVEFAVSGATSNRFFIDVDSLSVGKDEVVRYALVVRSPSGAENVSFEGIRCETREVKFYAFGQRNGSWSPARDSQWRYIEYREANRQHGVLFKDIFCGDGARPFKAPQIVQRLRYGVPVQHAD
jgi:hypothetical protein